MEELKLRVAEAAQDDVNRGIVRIDSTLMKKLGLVPGEAVEIEGQRKSVAIVERSYPGDLGLEIIRMDGITRKNASTSIGETVKVRKIKVEEAKKVVIAPAMKGVFIKASSEFLKQGLLGKPMIKGDLVALGNTSRRRRAFHTSPLFDEMFSSFEEGFFGFGGLSQLRFIVVSTNPANLPVLITENTIVEYSPQPVEIEKEVPTGINYEDVGGLKEEISKIREMVELPLKHPEIFEKLGIEAPKGVLLHGPPGTGKTLLAKAVANETNAHFITINGPEIISKWYGGSEENLRKIFEEGEKRSPSIIFIDEIDAIAPKREEVHGEVERRVVAQLLSLMDGLKSRGKVVVIAATNRPNSLDPALRRPGRFDREIEIGVPSKEGRLEILKIHCRNMPLAKDVDLNEIAEITYGFVGADLAALSRETAMVVLRRVMPELKLDEDKPLSKEILEKLQITQNDFKEALKVVRPSAMREVMIEIPEISWEDIGGLEEVKKKLREAIEWPLKYPESFRRMGIKPPKGILLYGPPGTGKTLLAKAVAHESQANFILVNGPSLLSMYVGESERHLREIFRKARQTTPCIIFFDEIDALFPRRGLGIDSKVTERMVNQMFGELDGLEELRGVIVIGATNRPDILDVGLLRPGRFDRIVYVPIPDEEARKKILEVHTKKMPLAKGIDLKEIAKKTGGYSGADLEALCREAALISLRENLESKQVTKKHFEAALKIIKPSIPKEVDQAYQKLEKYFQKAKSGIFKKPGKRKEEEEEETPDYFG